eukprot:TRINITY_DN1371_c0_g1_i10.p1 TRINITY_DN1371_c0_g1~~TRINITY_DN1371_c0_g1_i10.p1  ORF type:complete len:173 (-),score=20.47 TRINITY_DN1371_c0_g1_i10:751-1269(-)
MTICPPQYCHVYFFFLMIRRPPRSTQSRSSAASDVYKRQAEYMGNIAKLNSSNKDHGTMGNNNCGACGDTSQPGYSTVVYQRPLKGVMVSIVQGDIGQDISDVYVIAADTELNHRSTVSARVVKKSGAQDVLSDICLHFKQCSRAQKLDKGSQMRSSKKFALKTPATKLVLS